MVLVPLWPTQPWFPKLVRMIISTPLVLPLGALELAFKKDSKYPRHKNLSMVACPVSGKMCAARSCKRTFDFMCSSVTKTPRFIINTFLKDGIFLCWRGIDPLSAGSKEVLQVLNLFFDTGEGHSANTS